MIAIALSVRIRRRHLHAVVLTGLILCSMTTPANSQTITDFRKLLPADPNAFNDFGNSVALSGNLAIVGAPRHAHNFFQAGAAYLFDTTTGQQVRELLPTGGTEYNAAGYSVDMSGNVALVGAYLDQHAGSQSGAAFLFDVTTGQQLFKLTASNAAPNHSFGMSVSVSGQTAVVGSALANQVYVFDVATGTEHFRLTADDGAGGGPFFGSSVGVSGNIAIVGAPFDNYAGTESGSAYLFDTLTGQQLFKLKASDAEAGDRLGDSVAIHGNFAIVSATFDNTAAGNDAGSAYLFDVTTGQQLRKLTASDAHAVQLFGDSVDISGDRAIVGATRHTHAGIGAGSAYVFDLATGAQINKLIASDAAAGDLFGNAVAITGSVAVVGAFRDTNLGGTQAGAAYQFAIVPEPTSVLLFVPAISALLAARISPRRTHSKVRRGTVPEPGTT